MALRARGSYEQGDDQQGPWTRKVLYRNSSGDGGQDVVDVNGILRDMRMKRLSTVAASLALQLRRGRFGLPASSSGARDALQTDSWELQTAGMATERCGELSRGRCPHVL